MEVFHSKTLRLYLYMTDNQTAEKYFAEYNWKEVIHVSDLRPGFILHLDW